jgi:excisionase family DNA binding protein
MTRAVPPPHPSAPGVPDPGFHTVAEAAALMRVSKMTIYRLIHTGDLDAVQISSHSFRIPAQALTAFLATRATKPPR